MRGRKGKYYSQVDDEDQTFLEQERRLIDGKIDEYDEESKLAAIEEESQPSIRKDDDKTKLLNKGGPGNKNSSAKPSPKSNVTSPRDAKAMEDKMKDHTSPKDKGKQKGKVCAIPEAAEEHEDELIPKKKTAVAPNSKVKGSQDNLKKSQQSLAGSGKNQQDPRKSKVNIVKEDDRNASDDDVLDQSEVVMNTRLK